MPVEVIDMLRDSIDEVRTDVAKLRDQMTEEHKMLGERVSKIEEKLRNLLWIVGPVCIGIGAGIREILLRVF